jgi:hypothetical protein
MDRRDACYCVRYQSADRPWLTHQRRFTRRGEAERAVAKLRVTLPRDSWLRLMAEV